MHIPIQLLAFICLAISTSASPPMQSTRSILPLSPYENPAYSEVVDCGNVAQADIFKRARLWILQFAPEDKMLLNDKETGDIVSHAALSFTLPRSEQFSGGVFTFSYVLTIECANRKFRSSVTQIQVFQSGNTRAMPLETFRVQNDTTTKLFQAELDRLIKTRLENLKLHVKDFKSF
jgi:hypothetical protein